MSGWLDPWPWWATALLSYGACWGLSLLYSALRPVRDFYVVQRCYYDRLYEHPWRSKEFNAHYHVFVDYLAAKALFETYEREYIGVLDDGHTEAEHSLFMVPARSKEAAIKKVGKGYARELLHRTPFTSILERRKYWQSEREEAAKLVAE